MNNQKVRIKKYSTCWFIASRSQLIDNSNLVICALLCKTCKYEISTEQKIGVQNTKKELLLSFVFTYNQTKNVSNFRIAKVKPQDCLAFARFSADLSLAFLIRVAYK